MSPTAHNGADLVVRLYELRLREPYLSAARWFDDSFEASSWTELRGRYPRGSREYYSLQLVLEHWELVGALLTAGQIDEGLLFDATGEHLSVWEKVQPWLEDARAELGSPQLFENVQLLVERHARWQRSQPPKNARVAAAEVQAG